MVYPSFFDDIEAIKLKDPLSLVLGAFEAGEYEISYLEVVKAAGHSCPTVAGAYIMTSEALKMLYGGQRALRGSIKVEFEESLQEGVAGVIANVISHITGATDKSGFKGLRGQFARHSLMRFSAGIDSSARFTRVDTQKSVDVYYNHTSISTDPQMTALMKILSSGDASSEDVKEFGRLWQDRVKRIFENLEDVVQVREL